MIAACSPIDSPVRGSLLTGISTPSDGGQLAHQLEPVDVGLRPAQPEQHAAQVVAEGDRRVGGGVHAAGGGHLVPACGDAVGGGDRRLQPRAAGLLDDRTPGVYDDSALPSTHSRIRLKSRLCLSTAPPITAPELLAAQVEAIDQPAQCRGEHVLVGGVGVGAIRPGERNPVAAENGDPSSIVLLAMGAILLTVLTLE